MTTAAERLAAGYYNSGAKTLANPGGMAADGHVINFPAACEDIGAVGVELAGAVDGAEAAAAAATAAKNDAEAALGSVITALDDFEDRNLGAKESDPVTDNDGDPLEAGALYFRTTAPKGWRVWDGDSWEFVAVDPTGLLARSGGSMTGPLNTARATVASHATTADIWSPANEIDFTGAATVTNFPAAPQAGAVRVLHCAGAVFTNNANIAVQGAADYTTVAGDLVIIRALTTSTFRATILRADGRSVVTPTALDGDLALAVEATVASAATCDIGAAASNRVVIPGTTTITSFGTAPNKLKIGRFSGALTLTHNATSLILPGGANIVTAAGDTFVACSDGSGNWRIYAYARGDARVETGTFTPAFGGSTTNPTGATYTAQTTGRYTKIGRHVFFYLRIRLTGYSAAGTGNAIITGLPYPPVAGTDVAMALSLANGFTGLSNCVPTAQGFASTSYIELHAQGPTSEAIITWSNMTTTTDLSITGHFQTAS